VRLSRRSVTRLNHALDEWVPPKLRDSRLAAWTARRMYGNATPIPIHELKDRAFELGREEYSAFYRALDSRFDLGETDLTPASEEATVAAVRGRSVLDVACGKGHLARRLRAEGHHVVGCDVALHSGDRALAGAAPIALAEGLVEELPFRDRAFETVVSTHTLEHVQHLGVALAELRRVARQRVVIVVPRQRPYAVTYNPHIHFFPYRWSLLAWTGTASSPTCELVGGDWLYVEDVPR